MIVGKVIDNLKVFIKHKSFQNFIIIGLIAVLQLINNVYLGRILSKDDFGQYSFVFLNVNRLFSILFLFGIGASIMRHFSSDSIYTYRWKKFSVTFLTIICIPIIIGSLVVKTIYNLDDFWFIMILAGATLSCVTVFISYILKSQGRFNISVIIAKSTSIIVFVIFAICFIFEIELKLKSVSLAKLFSFLPIIFILLFMMIFKNDGEKSIGKDVVKDGFVFWEMSLTVLAMNYIDALLIAKILDFEELALYSIMLSIMQVYEFTRQSITNVYIHKFSQNTSINIKVLFRTIVLIAIALSILYIAGTDLVLNLLFNGKYSPSFLLIVLFCILCSISILYIIPSCYLTGKSTKKELRVMMVCNISSLLIKVVFIMLLKNLGLVGFVVSGILSQGFRCLSGYVIMIKGKE